MKINVLSFGLILVISQIGRQGSSIDITEVDTQMAPLIISTNLSLSNVLILVVG